MQVASAALAEIRRRGRRKLVGTSNALIPHTEGLALITRARPGASDTHFVFVVWITYTRNAFAWVFTGELPWKRVPSAGTRSRMSAALTSQHELIDMRYTYYPVSFNLLNAQCEPEGNAVQVRPHKPLANGKQKWTFSQTDWQAYSEQRDAELQPLYDLAQDAIDYYFDILERDHEHAEIVTRTQYTECVYIHCFQVCNQVGQYDVLVVDVVLNRY
jgi:hypothetical protein